MTILRMRIACCITKATHTPSEYVIHSDFHSNNDYANGPQCYVYTYTARFFSSLNHPHSSLDEANFLCNAYSELFFWRSSNWGAKLTPHLHLVSMLTIRGTSPPPSHLTSWLSDWSLSSTSPHKHGRRASSRSFSSAKFYVLHRRKLANALVFI
jgi:hypothetical protein